MAQHQCPECSREIRSSEESCVYCARIDAPRTDRIRVLLLRMYNVGCLVVLALLSLFLIWQVVRYLG